LDVSQYSDECSRQLEKIIDAKARGKKTVNVTEDGTEQENISENLLEVLKDSV
jgi:non-homologous end joining protein Ku